MLLSSTAKAQSDYFCMQYAVWAEARNQSHKTQRAVMDVIAARVRKTGQGVCKVLRVKSQFPWARWGFKRSLDKQFIAEYNTVLKMPSVFAEDSGYIYFNQQRLPWGKDTKRIGDLYFSR